MTDHIENLRFVGKCLESDADSKGIGQGSEGARYCYSAATFTEKQTAELASTRAEIDRLLARVEQLKRAILQFRNEPILKRAVGIRSTAGYGAMQYAALDVEDGI